MWPTRRQDRLRFTPASDTADPDQRVLSDEDLEQAQKKASRKGSPYPVLGNDDRLLTRGPPARAAGCASP